MPEPQVVRLTAVKFDSSHPLPDVPECVEYMQKARRKGYDLYLILLPDNRADPVAGLYAIQERDSPQAWDWNLRFLYVRTGFRRDGVATEVLRLVKREFGVVTASVPEANLPAQLLLKKAGFRCTRTGRDPKSGTDYYVFRYPPVDPVSPLEGKVTE